MSKNLSIQDVQKLQARGSNLDEFERKHESCCTNLLKLILFPTFSWNIIYKGLVVLNDGRKHKHDILGDVCNALYFLLPA